MRDKSRLTSNPSVEHERAHEQKKQIKSPRKNTQHGQQKRPHATRPGRPKKKATKRSPRDQRLRRCEPRSNIDRHASPPTDPWGSEAQPISRPKPAHTATKAMPSWKRHTNMPRRKSDVNHHAIKCRLALVATRVNHSGWREVERRYRRPQLDRRLPSSPPPGATRLPMPHPGWPWRARPSCSSRHKRLSSHPAMLPPC
jgi:hypothetical protein